jgi:hypothetical protein
MLGKRLFSYFMQWRDVNENYKQTLHTKVNDKIVKMYKNYMGSYFTMWKKKLNDQGRQKKMKMVQEMTMQAEQAQLEALDGEKQLRVQAEAVKSSQRRMVDKTFRKLFYRRLAVALGRWKDICNDRSNKEDNIKFMIKRMRFRFLRQSFDRYLAFLKKSQQHSRNENGANFMVDTLNQRTMRKVYNAMCFYTMWRKRVKQVWSKVLYRFDFFQKQRSMKRWKDNAHEKYQKNLYKKQLDLTEQILLANEEIGNLTKTDYVQKNVIADKNKYQRTKAYRQIANFFMRSYTTTTGEKFYTWKQKTKDHLHK